MSKRAERACLLLLYPPCCGLMTALMALPFGNNPVVLLPVGTLVGWMGVMTYLAIAETKE